MAWLACKSGLDKSGCCVWTYLAGWVYKLDAKQTSINPHAPLPRPSFLNSSSFPSPTPKSPPSSPSSPRSVLSVSERLNGAVRLPCSFPATSTRSRCIDLYTRSSSRSNFSCCASTMFSSLSSRSCCCASRARERDSWSRTRLLGVSFYLLYTPANHIPIPYPPLHSHSYS